MKIDATRSIDDTLNQIRDHINWRRDHGLLGDATELLLQQLGFELDSLGAFTSWLLERVIEERLDIAGEDIAEIDLEDCMGRGPH